MEQQTGQKKIKATDFEQQHQEDRQLLYNQDDEIITTHVQVPEE